MKTLTLILIFILATVSTARAETHTTYRDTVLGDKQLAEAMVGTWKEIYTRDCIDGESLVIYYPDMRYEEYATHMAIEDCEYVSDNVMLGAGEFRHKVYSGTWTVRGGYIYYKPLTNGKTTSMRIISIDSRRASFIWDDSYVCEGYRVDLP
jgi:hypothetical protein